MGRASEAGGAPAFWPWLQVLRSAADASGRGELGEGADAACWPGWCRCSGAAPGGARGEPVVPTDDEGARFRLFDAACGFLLRRAERQPTVVVLEDIQWADESTLLLVEHLTPLLSRSASCWRSPCARSTSTGITA